LRSLWRLGATGDAAQEPPADTTEGPRKAAPQLVRWGFAAVGVIGACIAFNFVITSLMLWAEWTLLGSLFMG
jgi:hypothetical protein